MSIKKKKKEGEGGDGKNIELQKYLFYFIRLILKRNPDETSYMG